MRSLGLVVILCGTACGFGCTGDGAAGSLTGASSGSGGKASSQMDGGAFDAALGIGRGMECKLPLYEEQSPDAGLEGSGWHRIYAQGGGAEPAADGAYEMTEHRTHLVPGDHFIVSVGAFVEWSYPVLAPLAGGLSVHFARFTGADKNGGADAAMDGPAPEMLLEIYLVHGGEQLELLRDLATEPGMMGYSPYQSCVRSAEAPSVVPGPDTHLLLRASNLSGGSMGVVVRPPDYMTWVDVEVR